MIYIWQIRADTSLEKSWLKKQSSEGYDCVEPSSATSVVIILHRDGITKKLYCEFITLLLQIECSIVGQNLLFRRGLYPEVNFLRLLICDDVIGGLR